jgi:cell division initiation protein
MADVSPRELREGNIREAFRGYHHDDVDELLERAAATIDELNQRVTEMGGRMDVVEGAASRSKETEDILQRTLLLAQRTADEVVAESRENAQRIIEEGEQQARARVAAAEDEARNVVGESGRNALARHQDEMALLEGRIAELTTARDALSADVDALESYASEYRERIRNALESQLSSLDDPTAHAPGSRPELADVVVSPPPVPERIAPPPEPIVAADPGLVAVEDLDDSDSVEGLDDSDSVEGLDDSDSVEGLDDSDSVEEPVVADSAQGRRGILGDERFGLGEARPRTTGEPEVLDDDTFFASLREAVSDDAPLGPREDDLGEPETHGDLFDEDKDENEGKSFFRRKR